VELGEIELLREIESAYISTIHAFALRLITENSLLTGFDASFLDLSPVEHKLLMRESRDALSQIFEHEFDDDQNRIFDAYEFKNISHNVYKLIAIMRDNGLNLEYLMKLQKLDFENLNVLAEKKRLSTDFKKKLAQEHEFIENIRKPLINLAINEWETLAEKKRKMRRFEFIDYLESLNTLINAVKSPVKNQFHEILLDEFQDTNDFQYSLISRICRDSARIFTVGDAKQSIYRFQQADIKVFADFATDNKTKVLELTKNYRSHKDVINFCNKIFHPAMLATKREIDFDKIDTPLDAAKAEPEKPSKSPKIEVLFVNRSCEEIDEKTKKTVQVSDEAKELKAEFVARRIQMLVKDESDDAKKFKFSDIAILVRKRATALKYRYALNHLGIPALIFGGKNLLKQPVVLDVFYLLKFLMNQNNDINFAAVLKTPFVGTNDDAIFWLSQKRTEMQNLLRNVNDEQQISVSIFEAAVALYEDEKLSAKEILPASVYKSAGDAELKNFDKYLLLLHDFMLAYFEIESKLKTFNCLEILDYTMNRLDFVHKIGAYDDDRTAEANFYAFRDLMKEFQHRNNYFFPELVNHLQKLIDMEIDIDEAAPSSGLIDSERDAVRIMTIHKAKGLEFPAVFVVETEDSVSTEMEFDVDGGRVALKKLFTDKDFGICGSYYKFNEKKEIYTANSINAYHEDLNEKNNRDNLLESLRLFYVAFTRAEDFLFIAGTCMFTETEDESLKIVDKLRENTLSSMSYEEIQELMKQDSRVRNFASYLRRLLKLNDSPVFEEQKEMRYETEFEDFSFMGLDVRRWFMIKKVETPEAETEVVEDKELTEKLKKAFELSERVIQVEPESFVLSAIKLAKLMKCPKLYEFSQNDAAATLGAEYETEFSNAREKNIDAKDVGIAFHKITENADYSDFASFKDSINKRQNFYQNDDEIFSELKHLTSAMLEKREFVEVLTSADKVFTEVPTHIKRFGIEFNGIIDVVAEFEDKMIVLDYKTDKTTQPDYLQFSYENQLKLYCFVLMERLIHLKSNKKIEYTIFAVRDTQKPFLREYSSQVHDEMKNSFSDALRELRDRRFAGNVSETCRHCFFAKTCKDFKTSKK
ncbi:MAG: UvrD-helicase domain-containing protein, partial [Planctomycetes bacterium]|nr:UvrD-helicase domain-containing protein [Planctomycetota bacterium]